MTPPRACDEVPRLEGVLRTGPPTPANLAQYAEVLYLRYWRGWRLAEIGAHLGMSRQRVHRIERAALERLRHPARRAAAAAVTPAGSALRAALFPEGS
jgi:hypothetical protein